jgi:hypothetical protein
MAAKQPDTETLAAIRAHWARHHSGELTDEAICIARRGRPRKEVIVLVTAETRASSAWFRCLACPEGFQRYRCDVGASPTDPPARHVRAIQRHFRILHGYARFPKERIHGCSNLPALATYGPTTPMAGAHLLCALCPQGSNRIDIEDPPYGDARSFAQLVGLYPHLRRELTGLDPPARADRLEAHHRSVVTSRATQTAVDRAARRARHGRKPTRTNQTQVGIQALLIAEVRDGANIASLIAELELLAREHPVAYARYIAHHVPEMSRVLHNSPEWIADYLITFCGKPARSARQLWATWQCIPESTRAAAEQEGVARSRGVRQ